MQLPPDPSARNGFILCWAASKHPEWNDAIVGQLNAAFPGEPIFDDAGRLANDPDWRASLAAAIDRVRAILLVIERRAILRAELQPPGHDWSDDLLPRELHAALSDRNHQVVPLLLGGAEIPPFGRLPLELKPLAMRRAIAIDSRSSATHDFTVLDQWLLNLAEGMSGSIAVPASAASGVANPAATIIVRPPPRAAPVVVSTPPALPIRIRRARSPLVLAGAILVFLVLCAAIFFPRKPVPPVRAAPTPSGRVITVREALALSPGAVSQRFLAGDFTVTTSGGSEIVLRPVEREYRSDIHLTVHYPAGRSLPAAGSTLRLSASSRFSLTEIRRNADGHLIMSARAP